MTPYEVLLLECSPRRSATSTRLVQQILPTLEARAPGRELRLTQRPIGTHPLPPLSAEYAESLLLSPEEGRARYGEALEVSDTLIDDLRRADLVLIATPVHNFTVPAALKTWIDYVVRRGVTFETTATGKVGLLPDRPVVVAVTSGGAMFRDPPLQPDFFRPYLRAALGVMGLKSVSFVQATGLAFEADPLQAVDAAADAWLAAERQANPGVAP